MEELGIFAFFLVLFFIAANPWVLIPAGILLIVAIVYAIKNPSKGGGGSGSYSGYSSYSTNDEHTPSTIAPSSNDGHIWRGRFKGDYDPVVATFRHGRIFDGYNSGLQDFYTIKASYENGYVYDGSLTGWSGTVLGRYERGYIYRGNSNFFGDIIGRYENGKIYSGTSTFSSDIIATYEGDDDGAAAAAVVYLFN